MATIEVVSADRHTVAEVVEETASRPCHARCCRPGCGWRSDPDEVPDLLGVIAAAKKHVDEPHGAFR
jgi:hypothetical protein